MSSRSKLALLSILTTLSIVSAACGTNVSEQVIPTAVALTVQAQNTQPAPATQTPIATLTPLPSPTGATPTNTARPTSPPPSGGEQACMSASLMDETIPDGTIVTPGQKF